MKTKLLLLASIALALLGAVELFAAVAPNWQQGPTVRWRTQSNPTFSAKDSSVLTAEPTSDFFGYWLTDATSGATQYFQAGQVDFDPVAIGTKQSVSVTVAGVKTTVTYDVLAALNNQAALDQWAKKP